MRFMSFMRGFPPCVHDWSLIEKIIELDILWDIVLIEDDRWGLDDATLSIINPINGIAFISNEDSGFSSGLKFSSTLPSFL